MNESAKCQSIPPAIKMKEKMKEIKSLKSKGIFQGADGLEGHFVVARPDMSILFSKADTFT